MAGDIIDRDLGQFPVSIGTSLALEGLLGIHPDQVSIPAQVRNTNELWIDGRTLVRNFLAACTADALTRLELVPAVEELGEEITNILQVMQEYRGDQYQLRFFFEDHDELNWLYPHAIRKTPRTSKQVQRAVFQERLTLGFMAWCRQFRPEVEIIRRYPNTPQARVMLLTHYPHELLWQSHLAFLLLLESHTGKIKDPSQWASKLHYLKKDDHLPFNRFTLQMFGDGQFFDGQPKALRDEVKVIAEKAHWTGITTWAKMRSDISRQGSSELKALRDQLR